MDQAALQAMAHDKLDDALILLREHRFANAYYLSGYAVELGLKAVIASGIQAAVIPDRKFISAIYTHDLAALLSLSGLGDALQGAMAASPALSSNWSTVLLWKEASRYESAERAKAEALVAAISDPIDGVLPWIAQHW